MRLAFLVFLMLSLPGCYIGGGQAGNEEGPVNNAPPTVEVNVPPANENGLSKVKDDLRAEIQNSSNQTQANLSGLMNASISKLAEKVVGLEAQFDSLVKIVNTLNLSMSNTLSAKLEAEANIQATMKNTVEMSSKVGDLSARMGDLSAQVQATITAVTDMRIEVGRLNNTAQLGIGNRLDQLEQHITNTAGRDVNFLPAEAVYLFVSIITALCGLATTVTMVLGRNARARDREEVAKERENVRYWQEVALKAIASIDPAKAKDVARMLTREP